MTDGRSVGCMALLTMGRFSGQAGGLRDDDEVMTYELGLVGGGRWAACSGRKGGGGINIGLFTLLVHVFFGCSFWLVVDCETAVCVWHQVVVAVAVAMEVVLLPTI